MKLIIFTLLLSISSAFATPKTLEVWFLSVDKTAFIDSIIPKIKYSKLTAQYQCQKIGDYCFDPQIGLYKKENDKIVEATDYSALDTKEEFNEAGEYKEGEYDPCKNPGHFDIFCKKGSKKKVTKVQKQKLELWVDISSTMKQVDGSDYKSKCVRERFLERVGGSCPLNEKMKVYIFDENRKELGNFDRVCLNSGTNRVDRLIRDIKASTAESLIIITDIYEAKAEFIDFVEQVAGGSVKGIDKPLYAKDILNDVSRIQKMCN
jgi:hypothetical protein